MAVKCSCAQVFGISRDRIFVSVYQDDEEAFALWTQQVGVSPSHLCRMGAADNFWASGPTGASHSATGSGRDDTEILTASAPAFWTRLGTGPGAGASIDEQQKSGVCGSAAGLRMHCRRLTTTAIALLPEASLELLWTRSLCARVSLLSSAPAAEQPDLTSSAEPSVGPLCLSVSPRNNVVGLK